ncbi:F-box/kelch-repeat protein At3g23880-like [Silene latifolia]|uniref:F-box/kelch-repeat protein At3g23880-like n=1 Tax=Silene latifolia TaxID=37657 RepID=UPI003D76BCCA
MDLPDELLILILVLLPIKSLSRFKCVCKHWLSVIQSREFVEQHGRLSETRENNNSKLLCYRKDPTTKTHVISILDRHTLKKLDDLEWPPFLDEEGVENVDWPPDETTFLRKIEIFGPVNGIYCIFRSLIDKWVGTLTLWNPTTREYKHIRPQVFFPFSIHLLVSNDDHQQTPESLNIGFGFDHTSNAYKVVVIYHWCDSNSGLNQHWQLTVYNHASDTWRTVYSLNCVDDPHPEFKHLDRHFPLLGSDPAISHCLLNGVFHWACNRTYYEEGYNILTFDMSTEVCHLINGPLLPDERLYWSVSELKGNIAGIVTYYSEYPSIDEAEVWMMMEYGVANSWAKFFTVREGIGCISIGIPCDEWAFFYDWNGELISARIDDDHCVEKHGVYGMIDSTYCGIWGSLRISKYVESLTTLKSV